MILFLTNNLDIIAQYMEFFNFLKQKPILLLEEFGGTTKVTMIVFEKKLLPSIGTLWEIMILTHMPRIYILQLQTWHQNVFQIKKIKIKLTEPSWINAKIKQYIRKRKRAKRTNTELHWTQFKTLSNKTVSLIRDAKKSFPWQNCFKVNKWRTFI